MAIMAVFLFMGCPTAHAEGFLRHGSLQVQGVLEDLHRAMAEAHGQAHIRTVLKPIFDVLPKNAYGRIDGPMLRYALHRYFINTFSIQVRGLEPRQNAANASSLVGNTEIYQDRVPASVEAILEGRFAHNGFGLDDAAAMAAVFEELVLEPHGEAFEASLARHQFRSGLTRQDMKNVLRDYSLQWLVGFEEEEAKAALSASPEQISDAIPQWASILDFVAGEIDRIEDTRHHHGKRNPFGDHFHLADLKAIIRSITSSFGFFWEQECQSIKSKLALMDPSKSGRVRLSDFYQRSMDGEWRFSESEAYLKALGALDSTSRWNGPQVVMPNYLLGPNNCIVSSTYYHVCCVNECEALLGEVEKQVAAPVATPEQVLSVVTNMTEEGPQRQKLWGFLQKQLGQIADKHRGKIPLHGRLFSQWMHYVFPQECPFPNHAGTVTLSTPQEFGDNYIAEPKEMKAHTKNKKRTTLKSRQQDEELWMSQWTEEEELLADYVELQSSFGILRPVPMLAGLLCLVGWYLMAQQKGQLSQLRTSPSCAGATSKSSLPTYMI